MSLSREMVARMKSLRPGWTSGLLTAKAIGLGVDGLITNRPGVAREVVDRYARMTQAERLLLFIITSLGAEQDVEPPAGELRP